MTRPSAITQPITSELVLFHIFPKNSRTVRLLSPHITPSTSPKTYFRFQVFYPLNRLHRSLTEVFVRGRTQSVFAAEYELKALFAILCVIAWGILRDSQRVFNGPLGLLLSRLDRSLCNKVSSCFATPRCLDTNWTFDDLCCPSYPDGVICVWLNHWKGEVISFNNWVGLWVSWRASQNCYRVCILLFVVVVYFSQSINMRVLGRLGERRKKKEQPRGESKKEKKTNRALSEQP